MATHDIWAPRWLATPQLRFVVRELSYSERPGITVIKSIRILQQQWQHEETGHTQWRDVPETVDHGDATA
jgi:hypothetical protein